MQAVITLYNQGLTMGKAGNNKGRAGKRSTVAGWSTSTTRRHTRWLYSVDHFKLDGIGYAFTLTLKDCPPSSDDWALVRDNFFKRLRRLNFIRLHWLTEWQRRGVPHLHGSIYFPEDLIKNDPFLPLKITQAWRDCAGAYGVALHAQNIKPIDHSLGWLKYLAKHASRGLSHYQRSNENIPAGWVKTGRMWGKLGDWPESIPKKFTLSEEAFFKYRRLVRSWRLANCRAANDRRRVLQARKMLQHSDSELSRLRGVSEWIDQYTAERFIAFLAENSDHPNYVRLLTVEGLEPQNEDDLRESDNLFIRNV